MSATPRPDRHYSTHSPDQDWDYVVVGSGMGGLTTAAVLSQLGKRVLVLEQHYVPGGFTHTFRRQKWVWDVGVHAVGEVDPRAALGKVLRRLTGGALEWASLGRAYDEFHFPDLRLDFPDNKADLKAALEGAFPSEKVAIERYFERLREVGRVMRRYWLSRILPPGIAGLGERLLAGDALRLLDQLTISALDEITSDERLKTVLTAQWGYYGVPPERSSFAIHALAARHFFHGGFYPIGGSASIARHLCATIAGAGGWTRIRADVAEILIEDGAAVGVRLHGGETIRARRVVSAAGALPTVTRLLPEAERQAGWARAIARLTPSPCHVCLYLGFKGDIRAAGAGSANKWFYETWDRVTTWDVASPTAEAPVLYCSFPSLKDPAHDPGPEQLHTGEVVTFVPYELFAPWRGERWHRRGDEYEALKQSLTERLKAQLLRHLPGLAPHLVFAELSTPVSTEHFTRAPAGAIYGIEPTPQRYRTVGLRPRTPIRNLFLSGSDMTSVGVMGAFAGGLLAAAAAEPLGAARFLAGL